MPNIEPAILKGTPRTIAGKTALVTLKIIPRIDKAIRTKPSQPTT